MNVDALSRVDNAPTHMEVDFDIPTYGDMAITCEILLHESIMIMTLKLVDDPPALTPMQVVTH